VVEEESKMDDIKYYKVKKGDTLVRLSYIFDVSTRMIKDLNNIVTEDVFPGQILQILDKHGPHSHLLNDKETAF